MISTKERKILVIIACIVSVITTTGFYLFTRLYYKDKREIIIKTVVIDQDYILATNKEITPGMIIQDQDLVWLRWPKFAIHDNYLIHHFNETAQILSYQHEQNIDTTIVNRKSTRSIPKYCPITLNCFTKEPISMSFAEITIDQDLEIIVGQNINLIYKESKAENLRIIKTNGSMIVIAGASEELLKINRQEKPIIEIIQ